MMLDGVAYTLPRAAELKALRSRVGKIKLGLGNGAGALSVDERASLRAVGASLAAIISTAPNVGGATPVVATRRDVRETLHAVSLSLRGVEVTAGFRERGRKPSSVDRDLSPDLQQIRRAGLALLQAFPAPTARHQQQKGSDPGHPPAAKSVPAGTPAPNPDQGSADMALARSLGLLGIRAPSHGKPAAPRQSVRPSPDVLLAQRLRLAGIRRADPDE